MHMNICVATSVKATKIKLYRFIVSNYELLQ